MKAEDVGKVGVVGCGVMGAGIVEVCARAGLDVRYVEANPDLVERGRRRIEASILRAVERGKLAEQRGAEELTRIAGSTTIDDLADRDLVIEAATEHQETKREVFRWLDEVTRPEVIVASREDIDTAVSLAWPIPWGRSGSSTSSGSTPLCTWRTCYSTSSRNRCSPRRRF
jgi:3-hydroxybutyryl-CoA dehydrogenase